MVERKRQKKNPIKRRRRSPKPVGEPVQAQDTLGLSFLDVLSCGLGASIYLFLVFSVMPHSGQANAATQSPEARSGSEAQARRLGARFDYTDAIRQSDFQIEIRVMHGGRQELHRGNGVFTGLPSGVQRFDHGDGRQFTFLAIGEDGADPSRRIRFNLKEMPLTRILQVDVSVWIAGFRQSKTFRWSGSLPSPLVEVDLSVADWILVPEGAQ